MFEIDHFHGNINYIFSFQAVMWGEVESEAAGTNCLGNHRACSVPLTLPDSITAVAFAPVQTAQHR